ncbi:hypothetical protein ABNX05_07505 [Lysinibacillus sp. M3]|uniref:Uncharacterized protein n=1 Tax=Lysinibacillus zambalensis TaxID=3160866 RepID=A0ABV1MPM1_9BACI
MVKMPCPVALLKERHRVGPRAGLKQSRFRTQLCRGIIDLVNAINEV